MTTPDRLRVLYDISTLGLGHLYQQSRGGAFRVDLHISEGLAASAECELLFCANHSAVAFRGCEAFLRGRPKLNDIPLVAAAAGRHQAALRTAASAAHRGLRRVFGSNVLPSAVRRAGRLVDRRLHPPVGDAGASVDVLHSALLAPLPQTANRRGPARLLTVYDLAFVKFPAIYGPAYRQSVLAGLRSLRSDDHIITTSRFARDEIAAEGIAAQDRIHVVPLAADPTLFYHCDDLERIAAVRRRYGIPDGAYVLGVNTPDPRKNVSHAVRAFALAFHEGRGALASLVLTGHPGTSSDRLQEAIAAHPDLRGRIILTGYVPDEDLAPLYTGAQVFVYNSIYEGFGLPPLEAMQCGTAVITSDTSSLPEVVGKGGVMVDPHDLHALARAILDLATDTDRHRRLQAGALAQARQFTWTRSTAATLEAYRAALSA